MAIVWRGRPGIEPRRISPLRRSSGMNRMEADYANRLEGLKQAGEILDYRFEAIKFRLADRTYYSPDFLVIFEDHFEVHECKGFWEDDARVKIKVTAETFPWFRFVAIQRVKKEWKFEEI